MIFFGRLPNIKKLHIQGTKILKGHEHILSQFDDLKSIDVGNMNPYKACPSKAHVLFDNMTTTVTEIRALNWEVSTPLTADCYFKKETLVNLERMKLTNLSFQYGNGLFGPVLHRDILPQIATLELLDLSFCGLTIISQDALSGFPNLIYLNIDGNPLGPKNLQFLSLPNTSLKKLHLQTTSIRSSHYLSYFASNILCSFPNLVVIDFSNNELGRTMPQFDDFSVCNISTFNYLESFAVNKNHIYEFVDLSGNRTESICLTFPNLKKLYLSANNFQNLIGLKHCSQLEKLDLNQNLLGQSDAQSVPLLEEIFKPLKNMVVLSLNDNGLQAVNCKLLITMKALQSFNISKNLLRNVDSQMFKGNPHLKRVDLSGNHIQHISPTLFNGLMKLEFIDLRDNSVGSLSSQFFTTLNSLPRLNHIAIGGNPFDCGCNQTDFRDWLWNKSKTLEIDLENIVCTTPAKFTNHDQLVYNFPDDPWECLWKNFLTIGGSILICFLITLAVSIPCYKYRWHVMNFKMIWKAFMGSMEVVKQEHFFQYDAYVSFDSRCVEDARFVAAELIPAIEQFSSTRTSKGSKSKTVSP